MGTFSVWHWLIVLFGLGVVGFFLWSYARIAKKAGFSGWWCLIMFVPIVNIVMIWIFAFVKWPAETSKEKIAGVFE
jgi:uncharacterized membrane protein YhaH (DUF805 family)